MTAYSSTPLVKKLGIKSGNRVMLVNAPRSFADELGQIPEDVSFVARLKPGLDVILFFAASRRELEDRFEKLSRNLSPSGMLWVAWPKKSSGVETDLSFDVVQKTGLAAGLVDTKVCAINDIWSGLKFVYRIKDRTK